MTAHSLLLCFQSKAIRTESQWHVYYPLVVYFFLFLTMLGPHCGTWAFPTCPRQALQSGARLRCPAICGILVPWPGIGLISTALESGFLTTGPAGKSLVFLKAECMLTSKWKSSFRWSSQKMGPIYAPVVIHLNLSSSVDPATPPEGCAGCLHSEVLGLPCCSLTQSCLTLWDSTNRSTPGFPVLHHFLEFAQTHIHWVGDAIQPSHLCRPLLLLCSIFPSIRVFSSESALCIRWPKC